MMTVSNEHFAKICRELSLNLTDNYAFKAELSRIYDHLIQIMGNDHEAIEAWMHTAKKNLDNSIPKIYLDTHEGLQIILKLLRKELEMDSVIG